MESWRPFYALMKKDLRCIERRLDFMAAAVFFSLLMEVLASFAFRSPEFGERELRNLSPGIIWLNLLFSGLLLLQQSAAWELEEQAFIGLRTVVQNARQVFVSKFFVNFLLIELLGSFVLLVHSLLFGAHLFFAFGQLLLLLSLFNVAYSATGTTLSLLLTISKERSVLFPLIFFPLLVPLLAVSVSLARGMLLADTGGAMGEMLLLALVVDFVYFLLSLLLFDVIFYR